MKRIILFFLLVIPIFTYAQNVGIGTTTPDNSAQLEIASNNKGILIPRMSKTERKSIISPAEGLLVYQTGPDSIGFYYHHNNWRWLNEESALPASAIVLSETENNSNLLNNNFRYKGKLKLYNAYFYGAPSAAIPGSWYSSNNNTAPLPKASANIMGQFYSDNFYVWGGYSNVINLNTGTGLYKYDPVNNTWQFLQNYIPPNRTNGAIANNKWVIWGGISDPSFKALPAKIYDFTNNTLTDGPVLTMPARSAVSAVAQGNEVYFWGGFKLDDGNVKYNEGFKYNTVTNTFTSISNVNAPEARYYAGAVSTGTKMIIWGGNGSTILTTGGIYTYATNSWSPISNTNAPAVGSVNPIMAWDGNSMIIISGNETKKYTLATNVWTTLAPTPVNFTGNKFAYDGNSKIYIWGGSTYFFPGNPTNSGYIYDITTNAYSTLPTANVPTARAGHIALYGNNQFFVWGGSTSTGNFFPENEILLSGGRYVVDNQAIAQQDSLSNLYFYEKK